MGDGIYPTTVTFGNGASNMIEAASGSKNILKSENKSIFTVTFPLVTLMDGLLEAN